MIAAMIFIILTVGIIAVIFYRKRNETPQIIHEKTNPFPNQTKTNLLTEKGLGAYQDIPLTGTLDINYQDAAGDITTRTIILKKCSIELNNDVMINAYCTKANDTRSFRLSRILKAIDPVTKQPINDIFSWFLQQFSETPYGKAHLFVQDNADAMKILFHFSRLDRQVTKAETKAIYKFMTIIGLNDEDVLNIAYRNCFDEYYELAAQTYTKALRKIKANKPEVYLYHLVDAANEITSSNKIPNEDKVFALQKIKREFGLN